MEEIDIWRTAKILVDAHGEEAKGQAAWRLEKAIEDDNKDAMCVWMLVGTAVKELLGEKPAALTVN